MFDPTPIADALGEAETLALFGLLTGLAFGAFAQRSAFCLRAATVEFARGAPGGRFAIWLLVFSAALAATQGLILGDALDVSEARQLAQAGSLSGAAIGGALFGAGMILARGCASRLLVLSATGNLRALTTGLILTIVAQASLRGVLSPAREALGGLWTVPGDGGRSLLAALGLGPAAGLAVGLAGLALGGLLAMRARIGAAKAVFGLGVGAAVAAGWLLTFALSRVSFEPVSVKSVSFTGPSADTLMALVTAPAMPLDFDVALVPGVVIGSGLAALAAREFRLQGFEGGPSMLRYIAGACLMGFGGMLAGGCAVGAGVTGGAIFALTAWVALFAMWAGAVVTDRLVDAPREAGAVAISADTPVADAAKA